MTSQSLICTGCFDSALLMAAGGEGGGAGVHVKLNAVPIPDADPQTLSIPEETFPFILPWRRKGCTLSSVR